MLTLLTSETITNFLSINITSSYSRANQHISCQNSERLLNINEGDL